MSKQSKSSNYFNLIQKKKLKMSDINVQKVTSIKFVNILSSLKRGWKKVDCSINFDFFINKMFKIPKIVMALLLSAFIFGLMLVFFLLVRSHYEPVVTTHDHIISSTALKNVSKDFNQKIVDSLNTQSKATIKEIHFETLMILILAIYSFLAAMFAILYTAIDSRLQAQTTLLSQTHTPNNLANSGSPSSRSGTCRCFSCLRGATSVPAAHINPPPVPMCEYCFRLRAPVTTASVSTAPVTTAVSTAPVTTTTVTTAPVTTTSVISAPITTAVITAPVLAQAAVINPTLLQTNQANANSSPSSQGVACNCCFFCQGTAPTTVDPIVTFNAGTEGVKLQD